ncbi:MAG: hypothetical protein PHF84_06660 [bacterium]|nr:hypothetical protein [bacterium]
MRRFLITFLFLSALFPLSGSQDEGYILNPFKKEYGSLLNYSRFKTFNQISFSAASSPHGSRSFGTYLSSMQYSVNNNMDVSVHLGKKFDFNQKDKAWDFERKEDYLTGGSVVYRISPGFKMGFDYGDTPGSVNYFMPFLSSDITVDKNMKFWLNKDFGKSDLGIYINYTELKVNGKE